MLEGTLVEVRTIGLFDIPFSSKDQESHGDQHENENSAETSSVGYQNLGISVEDCEDDYRD